MTGRDLLNASLKLIGVLASGEAASADEATDGLATLNRMLSNWSTENLLIYSKVREEFTLTPSDGDYTMGSSGNFNTSRPVDIFAAAIELQSPSPKVEVPVRVLTEAQWAAIQVKDLTSSIPTDLWPDMTNPLVTLNLYPVPTVAEKLVIYSWKELTTISTLDTSLAFPPGYEEALIYNSAIRLAPEYGRAVSDVVGMVATESKANIKRKNSKEHLLQVDSAVLGAASGAYNIYTGTFR